MTTDSDRSVGSRLFPDSDASADACLKHRVDRLSVFGCVLRGTETPDSDVDLLVEFEPGATPGFLGMAAIVEELSEPVGGRRDDLRTAPELSRYFRTRFFARPRCSLRPEAGADA